VVTCFRVRGVTTCPPTRREYANDGRTDTTRSAADESRSSKIIRPVNGGGGDDHCVSLERNITRTGPVSYNVRARVHDLNA